jgi:glutamate-ammonia-ligase adenylyltransferase
MLLRSDDPRAAALGLRALRRRELTRTGAGELLHVLDPVRAAAAISDAADVVLRGGLRVAIEAARRDLDLAEPPADLLVVAMGRLGGREMGYGSDADVMFVHEPRGDQDPHMAAKFAVAVATRLRDLLGGVGAEPPLPVDADLRPEGRQGPLVRTSAAYAEYYGRWSSAWEAQALLRARPLEPLGGTGVPGAAFTAIIDPVRYPDQGLSPADLREVRRIKARVEAERLPRGAEPARHLKLGPGGVADVEWTVQLLQLQHAHDVAGLRSTATMAALDAGVAAGLVAPDDAHTLRDAWLLASRLRSAVVLWSGRVTGALSDVLPHDRQALAGIARLVADGSGSELEERYLRAARRARLVVERLFFGG